MDQPRINVRPGEPRSWLRDRAALVCMGLGFAAMGIGSLLTFGQQPARIVLACGALLFACAGVVASGKADAPRSTTWAIRVFATLYAALYIYRAL